MPRTENRFLRDLKLLMGIGAFTALLIAVGGYMALRGQVWEESGGIVRELAWYAASAAVLLIVVAVWAWRVVRRLKRQPPPGEPPR